MMFSATGSGQGLCIPATRSRRLRLACRPGVKLGDCLFSARLDVLLVWILRWHPGRVPSCLRACIKPLDSIRRPAAPQGSPAGIEIRTLPPPPRRLPRGGGTIGMDFEMAPGAGSILLEGLVSSPSTQSAARPRLERVSPESEFRPFSPPSPPPPRGRGALAWISRWRPGRVASCSRGLHQAHASSTRSKAVALATAARYLWPQGEFTKKKVFCLLRWIQRICAERSRDLL